MTNTDNESARHPANAVFALMDDRDFRYSIIRPALEKDKDGICKLTTGKHQPKGFRHLNRAPDVMIVPVLSDEANLSADLAKKLLEYWLEDKSALKEKVGAKLKELGYEPGESAFDENDEIGWKSMSSEHAASQYDGEFLSGEDKNEVMLMSLLLGWFGGEEEEETEEGEAGEDDEA